MRSFEESSGGFSGADVAAVGCNDVSEAVEGAVDAGEGSSVDAAEAIAGGVEGNWKDMFAREL